MIKVKTLPGHSEAYILTFGSIRILILGKPDYSSLQYFRPSSTIQSVLIEKQGNLYLNSPYRLDLAHLKHIQVSTLALILISDFKSLLVVPYILRQKQIPIFLTQPMFQLGKLFCSSVLLHINNNNRFCQSSFLEEHEAFDQVQQRYNINLQNFVELYSSNELSLMHLLCNKLNPGQHYQFGELVITPYNSGASIVQCMWSVCSKLTKNEVVVVLNGSGQVWRHCKGIEVERLKDSVSHLVIGKQLVNFGQADINSQLTRLILEIEKRLRLNQSLHLHFTNNLEMLDLIELIDYHLNGVFKQLFVLDSEFSSYLKLANSFVEYLSAKRANLIHKDPPEYPFADIDKLASRGILSAGTLFQIAGKQKVPIKEVLLKYTPAIFMYMEQFYLMGVCGEKTEVQMVDYRLELPNLRDWISIVQPKSVWSYQEGLGFNEIRSQEIELQSYPYTTFNYTSPVNILKQCQLLNGQVVFQQVKQYLIVPKDWSSRISSILSSKNIPHTSTATSVATSQSKLALTDHTFRLTSFSTEESQFLFQMLTNQ